jgi:hypothetical protein
MPFPASHGIDDGELLQHGRNPGHEAMPCGSEAIHDPWQGLWRMVVIEIVNNSRTERRRPSCVVVI